MKNKIFELYEDKCLSVIVPVYNIEEKIKDNIHMLKEELSKYFKNWEIIVVSDGSTDNTYNQALAHESENVKVLQYYKNQGKGFALRYGFKRSKGDYIIFIDGGMELHPKEIKIFLALMDLYDADAVIGSKRHPQSEVEYPLFRRFLSRIYQFMISVFLSVNVTDTQVGLKLFKRKVLEDSLKKIVVKKYAFDLELLTVMIHLGYKKILEAPVKLDFGMNTKRKTLVEIIRVQKMAWQILVDTLAIVYRLRFLKYYD